MEQKYFIKKIGKKLKYSILLKYRFSDFDLLIGAHYLNLKIAEIPIPYQERVANETKMTSLISILLE